MKQAKMREPEFEKFAEQAANAFELPENVLSINVWTVLKGIWEEMLSWVAPKALKSST